MAVTQVGTPAAPAVQSGSNTGSVTGTFSGTQPDTAGDYLVARVTAACSTAITVGINTPAGWSQVATQTSADSRTQAAIYVKVAAGSDTLPAFTATLTGTAAQSKMSCEITELTGQAGVSPIGTSGTATGTTTSMSVSSSGSVPSAGCYALSVNSLMLSSIGTETYTPGSGYSDISDDGSSSIRSHIAFDDNSSPTNGSTTTDAATTSAAVTSWSSALIVVSPGSSGPIVPQLLAGSAAVTSVSSTITLTVPSGAIGVIGSIVNIWVAAASSSETWSVTTGPAFTTPGVGTNGTQGAGQLFQRVVDGTEGWTGGSTVVLTLGAAHPSVGLIWAVGSTSGNDPVIPPNPGNFNTPASTTITVSGITTNQNNDLGIWVGYSLGTILGAGAPGTVTVPSGWTAAVSQASTAGSGSVTNIGALFGTKTLATAGSTGNQNGTDTSFDNGGLLIAFAPLSSGIVSPTPPPIAPGWFPGAPGVPGQVPFTSIPQKIIGPQPQAISGSASANVTFTNTATGTKTDSGSPSASLSLVVNTTGGKRIATSDTTSVAFVASNSAGGKRIAGSATTSVAFTATAAGSKRVASSDTSSVAFTATASGSKRSTSSVTSSVSFLASNGSNSLSGSVTSSVAFTATATGHKVVTSSLSSSLSLSVPATGNKSFTEIIEADLSLIASAAGRKVLAFPASALLQLTATARQLAKIGPFNFGGSEVETNTYGGTAVDPLAGLGGSWVETNEFGGSWTDQNQLGATIEDATMQAVSLALGEFNDETINLAITNNGSPFNLTGYGINVILKLNAGVQDDDPSTLILSTGGGNVIITNPSGGLASVMIPNSDLDTTAFTFWRVDLTLAGAQETAIYGPVTIKPL